LQKSGVTSDRMVTEGKGDTELVNKEDKFAAENRRVHIVTLVQK
jgi:flagellar motor protein MotB